MTLDEAISYCVGQTAEFRERLANIEDYLVKAARSPSPVPFEVNADTGSAMRGTFPDDDEHNDGPDAVCCPGCETPVFWDTLSGSWRCPRCKAKGRMEDFNNGCS